MKVKELIQALEQFDGDTEVIVCWEQGGEYGDAVVQVDYVELQEGKGAGALLKYGDAAWAIEDTVRPVRIG